MASEERFGYEWGKYHMMDPLYKEQFDNWIGPLTGKDFEGKNVLDAGCGMGRNSFWALAYGAEHVTAFDYDRRSVEAARLNLKKFNNAEVFLKDIYTVDWENKFDLVFSIGVIHHLKEPKLALERLVSSLKPGGTLLVWVYSYEGNEWIVRFIDPLRKHVTSRLPVSLVHVFSYIFSVPLWLFVKIFKGPSPYLKQISRFKFWHIHSIVFDQLIPKVANYWQRSEVERLFGDIGMGRVDVYEPKNKSGWVVVGKK